MDFIDIIWRYYLGKTLCSFLFEVIWVNFYLVLFAFSHCFLFFFFDYRFPLFSFLLIHTFIYFYFYLNFPISVSPLLIILLFSVSNLSCPFFFNHCSSSYCLFSFILTGPVFLSFPFPIPCVFSCLYFSLCILFLLPVSRFIVCP